jgi:malonate decarboxylase gamma subunit
MVHAMGKASAARVTLRSVEELEALAASVPPMAYDIDSFASLGLLWETLSVSQIEQPTRTIWRGSAIASSMGDR